LCRQKKERALGCVVLSKKAEPAIDWFEIESRLQDGLNSQSLSAGHPTPARAEPQVADPFKR
jgi:hypothetical protein